jgi:dihydropteroate synthase
MEGSAVRDIRELHRASVIMGILNVTPDSFSDGGIHLDQDAAVGPRTGHGGAWGADHRTWAANPQGPVPGR